MSSGNYAGAAGWNNTGKPNQAGVCASAAWEPRGPGVRESGLCVVCGCLTACRGVDGLWRHEWRIIPARQQWGAA